MERAEREEMEKVVGTYLQTLSDALDKDLVNAPPEIQAEAKRESLVVKLTTIAASIPHPNLDRTVADIELGKLWDNIAPRYAEKPEALGPPDPEILKHRSWNAQQQSQDRAAKAARRR